MEGGTKKWTKERPKSSKKRKTRPDQVLSVCNLNEQLGDPLQIAELKEFGWDTLHLLERFDCSLDKCADDLERVDGSTLTIEEFVEKYEKPRKPVILTNLQTGWQAGQKWNLEVRDHFL